MFLNNFSLLFLNYLLTILKLGYFPLSFAHIFLKVLENGKTDKKQE